jgi:hypothetical protein
MAGFAPLTVQGNLNRVATHIVVVSQPQLSANASYLGKSLAVVTFEGPFTDQIETATGIVNSPKPFVMSQIVISLLRSQALSALWVAQAVVGTYLGTVIAYPDSSVFPPISLTNCSVTEIDPGAFDGMDPVTKATVKGTFYLNASLWAPLTGSSGNLPPAV